MNILMPQLGETVAESKITKLVQVSRPCRLTTALLNVAIGRRRTSCHYRRL